MNNIIYKFIEKRCIFVFLTEGYSSIFSLIPYKILLL